MEATEQLGSYFSSQEGQGVDQGLGGEGECHGQIVDIQ